MILTNRDLLQLVVVSLEDASVAGQVDGLILDDTELRIAGFLIDLGLYEARVLPFDQAKAIGTDAIIVERADVVGRLTGNRELETLAGRDIQLSDAEAITISGRSAGAIGAFLVDTTDGRVTAVELVPGLPDVRPGGRRRGAVVPVSSIHRVGQDIVVLEDDYKLRSAESESAVVSPPTGSSTGPPTGILARSEIGARMSEERHFLIGRTVQRDIFGRGGEIIARAGETVTPEIIRKAREGDRLLVLSLNVD